MPMAQRNSIEKTILNAVTPTLITGSTDATPIVVTSAGHGFVDGDRVFIYGHTTNIAANGLRKVTVLSSSTYSLQGEFAGENIAGSGAGAGGASGFCMKAPDVLLCSDFKAIDYQIITAGTATMTIKVAGSQGKLEPDSTSPRFDYPVFGATVSKTNPYSFLQIVNLDSGTATAGSTGIAVAGTDICNLYEANVNGVKYSTAFPTAWTQGSITVKAKCFYA